MVDGGSSDATAALARKQGAKVGLLAVPAVQGEEPGQLVVLMAGIFHSTCPF